MIKVTIEPGLDITIKQSVYDAMFDRYLRLGGATDESFEVWLYEELIEQAIDEAECGCY